LPLLAPISLVVPMAHSVPMGLMAPMVPSVRVRPA
jgi:hypothetical protein